MIAGASRICCASSIASASGRTRPPATRTGKPSKELPRDGLRLVPWGQGFKDMAPAIDALESAVVDRKLIHPNNPCLNWNMANAIAVMDPAGGRKLDKDKSAVSDRRRGRARDAHGLALARPQSHQATHRYRSSNWLGSMSIHHDLVGRRFGRLVVRNRAGTSPGGVRWLCDCDCGNQIVTTGGHLRATCAPTRSCGCLKRETLQRLSTRTTSGKSAARQRCARPEKSGLS